MRSTAGIGRTTVLLALLTCASTREAGADWLITPFVGATFAGDTTFLDLDPRRTPDDPVALAFGFLFAAPLEQAALAAATLPSLRSRHNESELTALRLVFLTAVGALVAKSSVLGATRGLDALLLARIWTMVVGEAALACLWGFVLAVTRRRTLGERVAAWRRALGRS